MGSWPSMTTAFLLLLIAAGDEILTIRPDCQAICGGVGIPYPFGIGAGCFHPGFEITCINNMPVLGNTIDYDTKIQVLSLSMMPRPEARVMLPVAYQCYNTKGLPTVGSNGTVDVSRSNVYRISDTHNELFVLGCNTLVYTNSAWNGPGDYAYYTGCVNYCNDSRSVRDGACAGVGCCHVDIPPGLVDNRMEFEYDNDEWVHEQEFSPCDYAFVVEKGHYTFRAADLTSMPVTQTMPLRLDWAIRDSNPNVSSMSCAQAANKPGYMCVSDHSKCLDSTNGPGYVCNCTKGYEGNPYLHKGCTSK